MTSKQKELTARLLPLLGDREALERFLQDHSRLPGPAGNITLASALAEVYRDTPVLLQWAALPPDRADGNSPAVFPAFCAGPCLGEIYADQGGPELLKALKEMAKDPRWRLREAAAFGFQRIGEKDFSQLEGICREWLPRAGNLEKRAILAALAHPPFLTPPRAAFCLSLTGRILGEIAPEGAPQDEDYPVLKKGLSYAISVFAAAAPTEGLAFMTEWAGKSAQIDAILKANLKKKRLSRKAPKETEALLGKLG